MADKQSQARLSGMLGLAMRAGKVIIGTEQICIALSKGKVRLVLISEGASDSTKKKIRFKCEFYKTRVVEINIDTEEMGRLLGKTYAPAAIAIADDNFAKTVEGIISSQGSL